MLKFKRIVTCIVLLALIISLGGETLLSAFSITAYAESSSYSNVLTDLSKDKSFDSSEYPADPKSNAINLIHIAEGDAGELYVYTYQPGNETKHRKANYLNMSLQNPVSDSELTYKRYSLTWLNSNGVFDKYIVNGFTIQNVAERYYNIASIYRPYDFDVDSSSSSEAIDSVQCKAFNVGLYWRVYYYNDVLVYEADSINVVEYKVYATGTVRYDDGINPLAPYQSSFVDSHYAVVEITNYDVDRIIDADITYDLIQYEHEFIGLPFNSKDTVTEIARNPVVTDYVSDKETGSNNPTGWFAKEYTWQRITTAEKFMEISVANSNEAFDAAETEALKGDNKFVFAFAETAWTRDHYNDEYGSFCDTYWKAENFGVLRLHFVSENKTYNLGVVGDLVGTDEIPEVDVNFADGIINSIEESDWWMKIMLMLGLIALLIVFMPLLSGFCTVVFDLVWTGIKSFFSLIFNIFSLPFKLFTSPSKQSRNNNVLFILLALVLLLIFLGILGVFFANLGSTSASVPMLESPTISLPMLDSSTISIDGDTLSIYDESGIAEEFDILADGNVVQTVSADYVEDLEPSNMYWLYCNVTGSETFTSTYNQPPSIFYSTLTSGTITGFPYYKDGELYLTEDNPGSHISYYRGLDNNTPILVDTRYAAALSVSTANGSMVMFDSRDYYKDYAELNSSSKYMPNKLFKSTSKSYVEGVIIYDNVEVSGRYEIKTVDKFLPQGCLIPISFTLNGESYDGIGNYDTSLWSNLNGSNAYKFLSNSTLMAPCAIKRTSPTSNSLQFVTLSAGDVLDFGSSSQDVPSILKDFLDSSCEIKYTPESNHTLIIFDLLKLNLVSGTYSITVKAKASGYADSTSSNAVSYTVWKELAYTLSDDGTYYTCNGIGTITDKDIVILSKINGIPVTSIDDSAFSDCRSITSVTIPASVTSIGDYAFPWCSSLKSITVDENNTAYKSIDGNLYTKDGETLIQYAIGKTDTSFTIPDSVIRIGIEAFAGCESLTSVTIPDSVTSIGSSAFWECSSLSSVTIPDRATLPSLHPQNNYCTL